RGADKRSPLRKLVQSRPEGLASELRETEATMFGGIELGIEFFEGLLAIDEAIVERAAREPCRECGGPLHRGDHLRKPRGGLLAIAGQAFIVSYLPHGAEIQTS